MTKLHYLLSLNEAEPHLRTPRVELQRVTKSFVSHSTIASAHNLVNSHHAYNCTMYMCTSANVHTCVQLTVSIRPITFTETAEF